MDYILLVLFFIVEPEKRRFDTVSENDIKKYHVRENDCDLSVFFFRQQFGVKGDEQKAEHTRKYGCESVDERLFE